MTLEVKPRLIYEAASRWRVQGIGRDITGRDAAELELRHAQKLESVGRLAAGIAHEINTPIQFVGDNTRFLQDSFGNLQVVLSKYQELRDAAAAGATSPSLLAEVRRVEEETDCAYLVEQIPQALTPTLDGRDAGGDHRASHERVRPSRKQGHGRRRSQQGIAEHVDGGT